MTRAAGILAVLALAVVVALSSGPATASTTVDLIGTWSCCGASGGAANQTWTINSADKSTGKFSGTGGGGTFTFPVSGTATGNNIQITTGPYDQLPGYTATFTGTIAADTNSMAGKWNDTNAQAGTWKATRSGGAAGPVAGKTVNAKPVSGTVLVKLPGTTAFVDLSAAKLLPVGTIVDVTQGRINLTAAQGPKGKLANSDFYLGQFKIAQRKGKRPVTSLALFAGEFGVCGAAGAGARAAQNIKVRELWGAGKGLFRTTGRYSSATIRGTTWDVIDYCDGTLTTVTQGAVVVHDDKRNKDVVVKAPKSYFAAK
jgi:hypothetical protein